jgi:hypothetical protein
MGPSPPGGMKNARLALERLAERLLLPAVNDPHREATSDDFRRVVLLVAACAVGFFVPSLLIAQVPTDSWPLFVAAALAAGIFIGGSFIVIQPGSGWAMPAAAVNALIVAWLGVLYHGYYSQVPLLFMLVVAAHAVVHGLRPALLAAVLGALLVPFGIQAGQNVNLADSVYAFIYLAGAALVPWTAGQLARQRLVALRGQLARTVSTEREAVLALARAAEAKDQTTGDHVVRVGDVAGRLARRVGLSAAEAEDLQFAGMLHDVGKLHLPDRLLLEPGPLSAEDWEIVKQHTIWGERILSSGAGFELARRICRSHHENWDGSGYPDGLRGEAIPLAARIVRLADVLDALRTVRPYKEAWELPRCLDELRNGAGRLFDPELTRELLAIFDGSDDAPAEPTAPAELIAPPKTAPAFSRLSSVTARA